MVPSSDERHHRTAFSRRRRRPDGATDVHAGRRVPNGHRSQVTFRPRQVQLKWKLPPVAVQYAP